MQLAVKKTSSDGLTELNLFGKQLLCCCRKLDLVFPSALNKNKTESQKWAQLSCLPREKIGSNQPGCRTGSNDFLFSRRQPCWTAGNWPVPVTARIWECRAKCYFDFQTNSQTIKQRRRAARGRQGVVWTPLFCKHMEPLEQRFAALGPRLCGVLKLPQSAGLPAIQTFFFFFFFPSWLADDSLCKRAGPVTTSNSSQGGTAVSIERRLITPIFSTNLMLWHLRFDARRKKQLPIDGQVTADDRRRAQVFWLTQSHGPGVEDLSC